MQPVSDGKSINTENFLNNRSGLPEQRVEWCWVLWWQFCCGRPGPGCAELLCSPPQFPPCAHPPVCIRVGEKRISNKEMMFHYRRLEAFMASLHTTNCCWFPPMLVRLWVSWWALTSSWTRRGIAPCSRRALWLAGQRARLRIRPTVA